MTGADEAAKVERIVGGQDRPGPRGCSRSADGALHEDARPDRQRQQVRVGHAADALTAQHRLEQAHGYG